MKRAKRFLAALLCICALAGIMAPAASAVTTLSIINLTIAAPVAGRKPSFDASVPSHARSAVQKVEWTGRFDANDAFVAGEQYKLTVTMGIKPGEDCRFSSKAINAKVNTKPADEVLWYSDNKVEVIYTFPKLSGSTSTSSQAPTELNKIRLTVDAPSGKGAKPSTTASLPSTARSTVEKVEWSGKLDTDGTFMPRVKYTVTVTLGIKPGENCVFSDKAINATVNGKEADEVLWYSDNRVTVSYTFPAYGTGTTISSNWITMDAPAVGNKPASSAHLASTASTYVSNVRWEGPLDSSGRFQAGTEYTAYLTLRIKDEFKDRKFSSKSFDAYVNGVLIDEVTRVSDKEIIVPVEFEKTPGVQAPQSKVLEEAHLTIDAPVAGNTPDTIVEVGSNDGCYVKDVTWTGTLSGGKFQSGVEYTALITLGIPSNSSAKFSDTVFDAVVNGVVIDAATLTRVSDKELIVPVEFEKTAAPAAPVQTGFDDVPADSPFATFIAWAVEKKITSGTSATTFSPNNTCSQAQILTFLWKAKGSPEPKGTVEMEGFDGTEYYYKAAQWAAEQDILEGSFAPNTPCTRAMAVTYLWKQAGSPAAPATSFTDVPANADYAQAVAWAVANNVTSGTSATTFSPENICTRGQIATFLYRTFAD